MNAVILGSVRVDLLPIPDGALCAHTRMRSCCEVHCGHWICDDCDLYWDEGAFGGPWYDFDAVDARALYHGDFSE